MDFFQINLSYVVFCTQLAMFTVMYVSFQTYQIVQSSDGCIHSGKSIVSTMTMLIGLLHLVGELAMCMVLVVLLQLKLFSCER